MAEIVKSFGGTVNAWVVVVRGPVCLGIVVGIRYIDA